MQKIIEHAFKGSFKLLSLLCRRKGGLESMTCNCICSVPVVMQAMEQRCADIWCFWTFSVQKIIQQAFRALNSFFFAVFKIVTLKIPSYGGVNRVHLIRR